MEREHCAPGWRSFIQCLVSYPPVTDFFSRFIHTVDLLSLKISRGRFSVTGFLAGWPIVTLTTIGARSGKLRALPLIGMPDGEKVILIASNFGRAGHPSWYYNLMANPEGRLASGGQERQYRARQATGDERDLYWQMAVRTNVGYARYQERAGNRQIPILVLTPQNDQDENTAKGNDP